MFKKFLADESGATAIEYGLIAALVSVAGIVALESMGQSLSTLFTDVSDEDEDRCCYGSVSVSTRCCRWPAAVAAHRAESKTRKPPIHGSAVFLFRFGSALWPTCRTAIPTG